jgi:leucyl-tRNA synthetase
MDSEKAKWEITKSVGGERKVQYRLRDWLISRQRYWGAPIPMIYCETCASKGEGEQKEMPGWYAVPEKDLPVKLPYVKDFRPQGKGESPLASVREFYEVKCPSCRLKARRETDVSDTFLDSAWYYLRYPSAKEKNRAWSPEITKKWFPVNLYTGGAEHSVLHLLYVRFVAMAFHDAGRLHFEEPFPKFRAHGLLISEGAKMSKSKGNVINPDEYIKKFGADTLRMYLMFLAPFEQGGDFRDEAVLGIVRFLDRVWKLFGDEKKEKKRGEDSVGLEQSIHRTIRKITGDIESLHYNTAISALMVLLSEFENGNRSGKNEETFLKLLAPFAPHIIEELWHELGNETSIHKEPWPEADPEFLKEEDFDLVVQVNGKLRATVKMPRGAAQKEAEEAAFENPNVENALAGKKPKKVIFVPDRLINFVI